MRKFLSTLAAVLGVFILSGGSAYAFTVFLSGQVGASPVRNEVLLTDGTNSTWVATSTLGLGGSGGGTVLQINTTYPVLGGPITTTGTVSLAFGTTTSNTWAGTQTFTNSPVFSVLGAGTVNATAAGTIYNTSTSTPSVSAPLSYSGTFGSFIGGSSGAISCPTCLTANQTITLSGAVTGSGTTAITTAFGAIAQGVLGNPAPGSAIPTSQATSTLYGTGTGGQVLGWSNITGGLAFIATSSGGGSGTVTSIATNNGITGGTITTTGTIGLAAINAGVLGSPVSGAVPTSQATSSLYGIGPNGFVLAEVSGIPSWVATTTLSTISGLLNLATQVTGVLGITNGGTASSTPLGGILKGNGTSAIQSAIGDTDYQKPISLTTTGTSGAATFTGDVLNIPVYPGGTGGTPGGASSTIQYNANGAFGGASNLFTDGTNLGVGTTTPQKLLHVYGNIAGGIARFERRTAGVTGTGGAPSLFGTTDVAFSDTGTGHDFLGPTQTFSYVDNAGTVNLLGQIGAVRTGANNTGNFDIFANSAGVSNSNFTVAGNGVVAVGSTTPSNAAGACGAFGFCVVNQPGGFLNSEAQIKLVAATGTDEVRSFFTARSNLTPHRGEIGSETNNEFDFFTNNTGRMGLSATGGLALGNTYFSTDPGLNNAIFQGTIGVGITTPAATVSIMGTTSNSTAQALDVLGSTGTNLFRVRDDGRIGIGSSTPGTALAIGNGTASINLSIVGTSTFATNGGGGGGINITSGCYAVNGICLSTGGSGTNFFTQTGNNLQNNTGTALGINTAPSLAALEAKGTTTDATASGLAIWDNSNTNLFQVRNDGKSTFGGSAPLVQIGSTTPTYGFLPQDRLNIVDNVNDYSADNSYNLSSGNCATADKTVANDLNSTALNFGDLGHTSSGFTGIGCTNNPFTGFGANATYLFDPNGSINIATGPGQSAINLFTGGYATSNIRMTVLGNGNVGIGTTSPASSLVVATSSSILLPIVSFINTGSAQNDIQFGENVGGAQRYGDILSGGAGSQTMTIALNSLSANTQGTSVLNLTPTTGNFFTSSSFNVSPSIASTTQPIFQAIAGAFNAATGVSVTSAVTGGPTVISATDTGANSGLTIQSKGTASLQLNVGSAGGIGISNAQISFSPGNQSKGNVSTTGWAISNGSAFNTVLPRFSFTDSGAPTALTSAQEMNDILFSAAGIKTHASGAIAQERTFRITPQTETFAVGTSNANSTIASSTAFSIDGPPVQGANVNFTNAIAAYVGPGTYTSSTTNSIGLEVVASAGATNNYAASTTGRWGMTGLGTGTGAGALCLSTANEILFASAANCVLSTQLAKHDITPITTDQASEVLKLSPVQYTYNDGSGTRFGFIAEQVAKIDSKLVEYAQKDVPVVGDDGKTVVVKQGQPLTVDYERYTGLLTAEVQFQQKEIDTLKSGTVVITKDAQDNWQDILIGLLIIGFLWQQFQINRLKK